MNALAAKRYDPQAQLYSMKLPFVVSIALHVGVFILVTISIPFVTKDLEITPQAVTVEMVDISEYSRTDVLAPPTEPKEEVTEEQPPKQEDPVYNNQELVTPQAPDIEEIVPAPPEKTEIVETPAPPEAVPPPVSPPKRKPKPPAPKVEMKKPETKPDKPPEKVQETPKRDITSILNDITPDKNEKSVTDIIQETTKQATPAPSQIAPIGAELTRSEKDALNRGVSPCWVVDAGAKGAENLKVKLRVHIDPSMTVRNVEIMERVRYQSDPQFKAAADSARRALMNPRCSKLNLPPAKYEQWKTFIYNFDPKGMI